MHINAPVCAWLVLESCCQYQDGSSICEAAPWLIQYILLLLKPVISQNDWFGDLFPSTRCSSVLDEVSQICHRPIYIAQHVARWELQVALGLFWLCGLHLRRKLQPVIVNSCECHYYYDTGEKQFTPICRKWLISWFLSHPPRTHVLELLPKGTQMLVSLAGTLAFTPVLQSL